jgi:hypothetical protein
MVVSTSAGEETLAELGDLVTTAHLLAQQGDYIGAKVLY